MTGRLQGPVKHDRTRPVEENHFWNLTGNDQTLEAERLVSLCAASGQQTTVEIWRTVFEAGDTWRVSCDRTLRAYIRSIGPKRSVTPRCVQ